MITQLYRKLFFVLPFVFFLQTRFPLFNQYYASDYLIGFLYLRELIVAAFVITASISEKRRLINWIMSQRIVLILTALLVLGALLSSIGAAIPSIALYRTLLLCLYIIFMFVFSYTVYIYHQRWSDWLIWWFIPFILLALMGLFEFTQGHSLGIWILGNWKFSTLSLGIAKASLFGAIFLRPYTTFPHPNVLGGVSSIFFLLALHVWLHTKQKPQRNIVLLCVSLLWMLVIISFSRSAWFGLLVGSLVGVGIQAGKSVWFLKHNIQKYWALLIGGTAIIAVPYMLKLLSPHAPSIVERIYLLRQAAVIIQDTPMTGVGYGNFVASLVSEVKNLPPIVYQPVHNVWFLAAAEIGVIGAFVYFCIWVYFLFKLFMIRNNERVSVLVMVLSVMVLIGALDHYFWSISIGQMVWWFILSLCLVVIQSEKQYVRTSKNNQ